MKKNTAETAILSLPAHLDLPAAGPLHEQLLGYRGGALGIDASRVESVGGQCLQVLLSAVATWRADGVVLSFLRPSAGFENGLALLGLSLERLGEQEVAQ